MAAKGASSNRNLKLTMLIGNLIFCILGAVIIAVGIYLIVEKIYYIEYVYGTILATIACYFIISAGCIMFLISFIGCIGALYENKRLLIIYASILTVVFMLLMMGAVIAIVFQVWTAGVIRVYMQESLLSIYGTDTTDDYHNLVTRSWDMTQEKLGCCAVDDNGWYIYRQTFWYKDLPGKTHVDKPFVPPTCCKKVNGEYFDLFTCQMSLKGPPGNDTGPLNPALFYRGCFNAGKDALYPMSTYFIVIGFVVAALVVAAIVVSLALYLRV